MAFSIVEGVEHLRAAPVALRALTAAAPAAALRFREDASAWTIVEIASHMADGEITDWMPRVAIMLSDATDRTFTPYDRRGGFARYRRWNLPELLDEFDRLRRSNVERLLALKLTPESLNRTAVHPELGTVTLEQLLACWVAHDCAHFAQISRVLTRYFGADAGPWKAYMSLLR